MRIYLLIIIMILGTLSWMGCKTSDTIREKPMVSNSQAEDTQSLDTTSPGSITLKWRTESEEDNYGFNLYRSLSKEGPWEKVNEQVVPGHGTTSEPHDYRYVDENILKNTRYYYQLEEIDMSGNPKRLPHTITGMDNKPVKKEEEDDK